MNKQAIIEQTFSDIPNMLVKGKAYHSELSPEISGWYCYILDSGHCILSIAKPHALKAFTPGNNPFDYLVGIPVKSVLRGYEVSSGFVVANVDYDDNFGVIVESEDDEF